MLDLCVEALGLWGVSQPLRYGKERKCQPVNPEIVQSSFDSQGLPVGGLLMS